MKKTKKVGIFGYILIAFLVLALIISVGAIDLSGLIDKAEDTGKVGDPYEPGLISADGTFTKWSVLEDVGYVVVADDTLTSVSGSVSGHLLVPYGITAIGKNAARDCGGLTAITIPSTLSEIEICAFMNCSSLKSINMPERFDTSLLINGSAFLNCASLESLELVEGISLIGNSSFKNCTALKYVFMSDTVCEIGKSSFYGCEQLALVRLSANVETIPGSAFYGCRSLSFVDIPENSNLTDIQDNAFSDTTNLKTIVIPEGVEHIGNSSFKNSTVETVILPETVISIGTSAFYGCKNLREISFPSSFESIGGSAFYGCESLYDIELPASIKYIGPSAFKLSGVSLFNYLGTAEEFNNVELLEYWYGDGQSYIEVHCSDRIIGFGVLED